MHMFKGFKRIPGLIITIMVILMIVYFHVSDHYAWAIDTENPGALRFLSYMWVHVNLEHLITNIALLLIFGVAVEANAERVSRPLMLAIYILGGIIAAIAETIFGVSMGRYMSGASGAVSAIMGMATVLVPGIRLWRGRLVAWAASWVVVHLIGLVVFGDQLNTALTAHLAGFAVGLLGGLYMRLTTKKRKGDALEAVATHEMMD